MEINLDNFFAENCWFTAEGVGPDWAQQSAASNVCMHLHNKLHDKIIWLFCWELLVSWRWCNPDYGQRVKASDCSRHNLWRSNIGWCIMDVPLYKIAGRVHKGDKSFSLMRIKIVKSWSKRSNFQSTLKVMNQSQLHRMTFVCGLARARQFMQIVWLADDSYEPPGLISVEEGMMFVKFFTAVCMAVWGLKSHFDCTKLLRLVQLFLSLSLLLSLVRFRRYFNNLMLLTLRYICFKV